MLQLVAGPCSEVGHTEGFETSSQSVWIFVSALEVQLCPEHLRIHRGPPQAVHFGAPVSCITEYITVKNVTFSHLNFIHLVPLFTPIPFPEHPLIYLV